jgi:hypothetical protein
MRCWLVAIAGLGLLAGAAGCDEPPLDYFEVKRIDEAITPAELEAVLDIASKLPGGKLSTQFVPYLPPPDWSLSRTLPVSELLDEERQRHTQRWSAERLAKTLPEARQLDRLLRKHRLTREQFAGLALVLGVTCSADRLAKDRDLALSIQRGTEMVKLLQDDSRVFARLSDDQAHQVLRSAAWLGLIERAKRLTKVAPGNLELTRTHKERLAAVLPEAFQKDPLADFNEILEQTGLPFTEQSESGRDEDLSWSADDAILGTPSDKTPAAIPRAL